MVDENKRARSGLTIAVLVLLAFALAGNAVLADSFVVDRVDDDASATACTASPNDCSLRGAILTANGNGVADTISFDGNGIYDLSIAGANDDACATGDLDISGDLTISGNGSANTVIDGSGIDRVFDIHPGAEGSITVTLENLTIQGGSTPSTGLGFLNSGAGIDFPASHGGSGTLAIQGCRIQDNATGNSNGGGIYVSKAFGQPVPVVHITDSEIMSNTAHLGGGGLRCDNCELSVSGSDIAYNQALVTSGIGYGGGGLVVTGASASADIAGSAIHDNGSADDGGGILFASGAMTITRSTIAGNTAVSSGGGISDEGSLAGGTLTVSGSTIADNTATGGNGGGIFNGDLGLTMGLSRIVGNWAGAGGTGIANPSGSVDAEDNWWGCDDFPGAPGCDGTTGTVDSDPRIDLALSATPDTILSGGTSSVLADVAHNSDGAAIVAAVLEGLEVTFAGNAFGSVAPVAAPIAGGDAGTTFTGASPGTADVSASLDSGTETTPITVVAGVYLEDLDVSLVGRPDPFCPGHTVTYTLRIVNDSPIALADMTVEDEAPPGTCCPADGAASTVPGSISAPDTMTWNVGSLDMGQSERIDVKLHTFSSLRTGDVITNTFAISATGLAEVGYVGSALTADVAQCPAQPTPTATVVYPYPPRPTPTPVPGGRGWLPMILR